MAKYVAFQTAVCPHCKTGVRFESALIDDATAITRILSSPGKRDNFIFYGAACPICGRLILSITGNIAMMNEKGIQVVQEREFVLWPLTSTRPIPPEVPAHIGQDYNESALVLNLSPKASAALSRRCLQIVLREAGGSTKNDLADQIEEVLPRLPNYLAKDVDAIRNIGNFAAHPIKSKTTDVIVDVEPGEAEWNLNVLDLLFDFYYVQPEISKKKREVLEQKLKDTGKPTLKKP